MNHKGTLLTDRTYVLNEGNWYSSLEKLRSFPSVEMANFYNTTSSAGDWEGYLVQKHREQRYLILFSQTNNWPRGGFTIVTDKVIDTWKGELYRGPVETLVSLYLEEAT